MTDERRNGIRRAEDNDIAARIVKLEENQDRFLDVLLGPEDTWGKRQERKGLVWKVDSIKTQLSNGGVRVKLPAGLWVLLVALTSGLAGIGIALIQNV